MEKSGRGVGSLSVSLSVFLLACAALLTGGLDHRQIPAQTFRIQAALPADVASRCMKPTATEPVLYMDDFKWNYTLPEMQARFDEIYASGRRLKNRAYYDESAKKFVLPSNRASGVAWLPERLIENVRRHIEVALERGYVQNIFFPDMGHSHFFIPQEHWDQKFDSFPSGDVHGLLSAMFDDPELKILYHTAEQLKTLDENDKPLNDRSVSWRFHTRNLVGDNRGQGVLEIHQNLESVANTLHALPEHFYYGAGFNISASGQGCFPYNDKGKVRYFDLSLDDLEPRQAGEVATRKGWK